MHPRSSSSDRILRAPFRGRTRPSLERRPGDPGSEAGAPVVPLASPGPPTAPAPPLPAPACLAGPTENEFGAVTYSCGCGFVFDGPVITSVACPHCGDAQAW